MNLDSNLKNTLSTVFGLLAVVCGAVVSVATAGVALPALVVTIATVGGAVSVGIIGWLTGKAANASNKTDQAVEASNKQSMKVQDSK